MPFNSKQYEWNDLSVVVLGRTITGIQGIKYTVKKEKEYVYGRGNKPLGIQSGNESVEGEITFLQSEIEALRAAAKTVNPAYKITDLSFDVVVSYGEGLTAVTDIVKSIEVEEYEKGLEQGDKFMEITLKFKALDVEEGVQ